MIDFAGGFTAAADVGERTAFVARVVVEELFTNLLRHDRGGSGDIEVDLSLDGDTLVLRLRDFDVDEPDMKEIERRRSERPVPTFTGRPHETRAQGPGRAGDARPEAADAARPDPGRKRTGGLGVRIVDTLTDRLEYGYDGRTLTVRATIHAERDPVGR